MKVLLVVNPEAGGGNGARVGNLAKKELISHSCEVLEAHTKAGREKNESLSAAWSKSLKAFSWSPDLLMVVGGDGTLNQVINEVEAEVPLAFVPAGTANVFAKELGIPSRTSDAVEIALKGRRIKIDVGVVNKRKFVLMTGVGIDAEVISKVGEAEKKFLGKVPFVARAFWEGIKFQPPKLRVRCGSREEECSFLIVANSSYYGGGLRLAPWALLDDGWLEVCLFKGKNAWQFFHFAFSVVLSQQGKLPTFSFFRAQELEVFSDKKVLVQCDSEIIGTTPVKISLLPNYLNVIVPQ